MDHHYDADHEDPGYLYYYFSNSGSLDGDIPFGGGFFGVSNSTSLSSFIENAWNGNGGSWSDGNARYYSASEAASQDMALTASFERWANSNATAYAICPTCPGGDKYKAYIDASQTFYYEDGVVTNTPGFSQSQGDDEVDWHGYLQTARKVSGGLLSVSLPFQQGFERASLYGAPPKWMTSNIRLYKAVLGKRFVRNECH
jgi:hypothetical protein